MDLDTGLNVLVVVVPVGKVASLTVVLRTRELGVHIRPGIHQKWTHFLVVKGTAAALGPRPYMGFIRLLQQLAFLGGLFILFFSPVGSFLRPRRGFSSPHTQHTEESHVWKWGRGGRLQLRSCDQVLPATRGGQRPMAGRLSAEKLGETILAAPSGQRCN